MGNVLPTRLVWGTFGKGGVEHCGGHCPLHPLRWKPIEECDTDHLQAILRTQRAVFYSAEYTRTIHKILRERGVKPEEFNYQAETEFFAACRDGERQYWQSQRENNATC